MKFGVSYIEKVGAFHLSKKSLERFARIELTVVSSHEQAFTFVDIFVVCVVEKEVGHPVQGLVMFRKKKITNCYDRYFF